MTRGEVRSRPLSEPAASRFDACFVLNAHPVEVCDSAAGAAGLRDGGGLNSALRLALNLASLASSVALSLALTSSKLPVMLNAVNVTSLLILSGTIGGGR